MGPKAPKGPKVRNGRQGTEECKNHVEPPDAGYEVWAGNGDTATRLKLGTITALFMLFLAQKALFMTALNLVELIEEMIEVKIRQHAAAESRNLRTNNPELARVIFQTSSADRERLKSIKDELVQVLESA